MSRKELDCTNANWHSWWSFVLGIDEKFELTGDGMSDILNAAPIDNGRAAYCNLRFRVKDT